MEGFMRINNDFIIVGVDAGYEVPKSKNKWTETILRVLAYVAI